MDDSVRISLDDGRFLVVRRDDATQQTHLIVEDIAGAVEQHLIMEESEAREFALALADAYAQASDITPEKIINGGESDPGQA